MNVQILEFMALYLKFRTDQFFLPKMYVQSSMYRVQVSDDCVNEFGWNKSAKRICQPPKQG